MTTKHNVICCAINLLFFSYLWLVKKNSIFTRPIVFIFEKYSIHLAVGFHYTNSLRNLKFYIRTPLDFVLAAAMFSFILKNRAAFLAAHHSIEHLALLFAGSVSCREEAVKPVSIVAATMTTREYNGN